MPYIDAKYKNDFKDWLHSLLPSKYHPKKTWDSQQPATWLIRFFKNFKKYYTSIEDNEDKLKELLLVSHQHFVF